MCFFSKSIVTFIVAPQHDGPRTGRWLWRGLVRSSGFIVLQVRERFLSYVACTSWTSRRLSQHLIRDLRIAACDAIKQPIERYLCHVGRAAFARNDPSFCFPRRGGIYQHDVRLFPRWVKE